MRYRKATLIGKCTVPCEWIIGIPKSLKTLENDSHKETYQKKLKSKEDSKGMAATDRKPVRYHPSCSRNCSESLELLEEKIK